MEDRRETQERTDGWSRVGGAIGRFLAVALRILFVIALGILLAVGVYFGVPWAYNRVVEPIQDGLMRLDRLEIRLEQTTARWEERTAALEEQVDGLASQVDSQADQIASLETAVAQSFEARAELEVELQAHQQTLEELSASVTRMAEEKADVARLGDLEEAIGNEIAGLEDQVASAEQVVEQVDTLRYGLMLLQTRGELAKAYLDLSEGNAGEADAALALAQTHLAEAAELAPEVDQELLAAVADDLTLASGRLRDQPVLAAGTLRGAWAELGALVP
jgi:DNA repair exonuclease SbcCD ATPase subunit